MLWHFERVERLAEDEIAPLVWGIVSELCCVGSLGLRMRAQQIVAHEDLDAFAVCVKDWEQFCQNVHAKMPSNTLHARRQLAALQLPLKSLLLVSTPFLVSPPEIQGVFPGEVCTFRVGVDMDTTCSAGAYKSTFDVFINDNLRTNLAARVELESPTIDLGSMPPDQIDFGVLAASADMPKTKEFSVTNTTHGPLEVRAQVVDASCFGDKRRKKAGAMISVVEPRLLLDPLSSGLVAIKLIPALTPEVLDCQLRLEVGSASNVSTRKIVANIVRPKYAVYLEGEDGHSKTRLYNRQKIRSPDMSVGDKAIRRLRIVNRGRVEVKFAIRVADFGRKRTFSLDGTDGKLETRGAAKCFETQLAIVPKEPGRSEVEVEITAAGESFAFTLEVRAGVPDVSVVSPAPKKNGPQVVFKVDAYEDNLTLESSWEEICMRNSGAVDAAVTLAQGQNRIQMDPEICTLPAGESARARLRYVPSSLQTLKDAKLLFDCLPRNKNEVSLQIGVGVKKPTLQLHPKDLKLLDFGIVSPASSGVVRKLNLRNSGSYPLDLHLSFKNADTAAGELSFVVDQSAAAGPEPTASADTKTCDKEQSITIPKGCRAGVDIEVRWCGIPERGTSSGLRTAALLLKCQNEFEVDEAGQLRKRTDELPLICHYREPDDEAGLGSEPNKSNPCGNIKSRGGELRFEHFLEALVDNKCLLAACQTSRAPFLRSAAVAVAALKAGSKRKLPVDIAVLQSSSADAVHALVDLFVRESGHDDESAEYTVATGRLTSKIQASSQDVTSAAQVWFAEPWTATDESTRAVTYAYNLCLGYSDAASNEKRDRESAICASLICNLVGKKKGNEISCSLLRLLRRLTQDAEQRRACNDEGDTSRGLCDTFSLLSQVFAQDSGLAEICTLLADVCSSGSGIAAEVSRYAETHVAAVKPEWREQLLFLQELLDENAIGQNSVEVVARLLDAIPGECADGNLPIAGFFKDVETLDFGENLGAWLQHFTEDHAELYDAPRLRASLSAIQDALSQQGGFDLQRHRTVIDRAFAIFDAEGSLMAAAAFGLWLQKAGEGQRRAEKVVSNCLNIVKFLFQNCADSVADEARTAVWEVYEGVMKYFATLTTAAPDVSAETDDKIQRGVSIRLRNSDLAHVPAGHGPERDRLLGAVCLSGKVWVNSVKDCKHDEALLSAVTILREIAHGIDQHPHFTRRVKALRAMVKLVRQGPAPPSQLQLLLGTYRCMGPFAKSQEVENAIAALVAALEGSASARAFAVARALLDVTRTDEPAPVAVDVVGLLADLEAATVRRDPQEVAQALQSFVSSSNGTVAGRLEKLAQYLAANTAHVRDPLFLLQYIKDNFSSAVPGKRVSIGGLAGEILLAEEGAAKVSSAAGTVDHGWLSAMFDQLDVVSKLVAGGLADKKVDVTKVVRTLKALLCSFAAHDEFSLRTALFTAALCLADALRAMNSAPTTSSADPASPAGGADVLHDSSRTDANPRRELVTTTARDIVTSDVIHLDGNEESLDSDAESEGSEYDRDGAGDQHADRLLPASSSRPSVISSASGKASRDGWSGIGEPDIEDDLASDAHGPRDDISEMSREPDFEPQENNIQDPDREKEKLAAEVADLARDLAAVAADFHVEKLSEMTLKPTDNIVSIEAIVANVPKLKQQIDSCNEKFFRTCELTRTGVDLKLIPDQVLQCCINVLKLQNLVKFQLTRAGGQEKLIALLTEQQSGLVTNLRVVPRKKESVGAHFAAELKDVLQYHDELSVAKKGWNGESALSRGGSSADRSGTAGGGGLERDEDLDRNADEVGANDGGFTLAAADEDADLFEIADTADIDLCAFTGLEDAIVELGEGNACGALAKELKLEFDFGGDQGGFFQQRATGGKQAGDAASGGGKKAANRLHYGATTDMRRLIDNLSKDKIKAPSTLACPDRAAAQQASTGDSHDCQLGTYDDLMRDGAEVERFQSKTVDVNWSRERMRKEMEKVDLNDFYRKAPAATRERNPAQIPDVIRMQPARKKAAKYNYELLAESAALAKYSRRLYSMARQLFQDMYQQACEGDSLPQFEWLLLFDNSGSFARFANQSLEAFVVLQETLQKLECRTAVGRLGSQKNQRLLKEFDEPFSPVVGERVLNSFSYDESSHLASGMWALADRVWGGKDSSTKDKETGAQQRSANVHRVCLMITDGLSQELQSEKNWVGLYEKYHLHIGFLTIRDKNLQVEPLQEMMRRVGIVPKFLDSCERDDLPALLGDLMIQVFTKILKEMQSRSKGSSAMEIDSANDTTAAAPAVPLPATASVTLPRIPDLSGSV
eukprot:g15530.t1